MRRLAAAAAALALLAGAARGESTVLQVYLQGVVRPGAASYVSFTVPRAGECDLTLQDAEGKTVSVVAEKRSAQAGVNTLYWNGTWQGVAAPEGEWTLVLRQGGQTASTSVTVGGMAPCLIGSALEPETTTRNQPVTVRWYSTARGTLTIRREGENEPLAVTEIRTGEGSTVINAGQAAGQETLILTLTAEDGTAAEPARLSLTVEKTKQEKFAEEWAARPKRSEYTPSRGSPFEGQDTTLNYWTLPMDITDTEAVWAVLTAPVTVVDNGKENAEKIQVPLRKEPKEDSPGIGVVTCVTQSVHVLEKGAEWSLVECYSSSFHDNRIKNWNALVQGWVPTAWLKETAPSQTMGLVVDKLTQKLYIFRDGELLDTLQVSTGLANAKQPYNETRSGEFLIHSWVGAITSDNIIGRLAMRFNDGDLIHEVPYILMDDGAGKDYTVCEQKLGSRASHGCIRVQRRPTPKGINHEWLWNHKEKDMKLLIWEDWQGRQIPYPAENTPLYVTSGRNGVYHTSPRCSQLNGAKTTPLTYGQLEKEEYAKAKRCSVCDAPRRKEAIDEINAAYAPGGDHDPVMTEAREKAKKALEE